MILEKALTLELRHFEDSEFYDKLTRARREASSRPLSLVQENFQVLRNGLTLAGYIALLVAFSPWLVLVLLLATVPAFVAEASFSGAGFRLRNWRAPEVAPAELPRIRDGQRRARQGGEAVRPGPAAAGPLPRAWPSSSSARTAGWPSGAPAGATRLSLLSHAAFYGCYALHRAGHGARAGSRWAT